LKRASVQPGVPMGKLKAIEHGFKALFFRAASPMLKRAQGEFRPLDGNKLHKVLFLRPEKIGDMVISFPVFDGLIAKYPHIKISVLGSPRNRMIIDGDPRFEHVFMYTKNTWRDIKEVAAIRRHNFDCVVDMICDDSVTALMLSQLTAPGKPRIGVGKVKYRQYYDFNYDHRLGNTGHIVENTLKLLTAFGIDADTISGYAQPYISDEAQERAAAFMQKAAGDATLRVGYNMSAGAPTRIWAEEKSVGLLQRILDAHPCARIILSAVNADRKRAERVREQLGDRVILVPEGLSLMEASAVISRLDLLISPDTSLVHIARASRVPVVGLYSRAQKNFLLWKPYDQDFGSVVSDNDDNLFDITVEAVFETFRKVVDHHVEVRQ